MPVDGPEGAYANINLPGGAAAAVRAEIDNSGLFLDAVVADGDAGAAPTVVVDVAVAASFCVPDDLA